MRSRPALFALALAACGPELNPPVPPPGPEELAIGGVWVAYNLGCAQGCDQIDRGDKILAVDGRPVSSGAEIDALDLTRGTAVALRVSKYGTHEVRDVTIVAEPRDNMPPLRDVPPMWTVGAAALDRAPLWARSKLFGHAIPALRFYLADEPRGFLNGRQLHGRPAVVVVWELPALIRERKASMALIPRAYAQLQAADRTLKAAGIDVYFVVDFRAEPRFREYARSAVQDLSGEVVSIFQLASSKHDPNVAGLEWGAADIREAMLDHYLAPVVMVFDRRGIVRFHARGFPIGLHETLAAAIDFATHDLVDAPVQPGAGP